MKVKFFKTKLAIILSCIFCLTGCWDNQDINHRALPLVMGVKLNKDNSYKITLEIPSTEPQGKSLIVSGEGETINEAVENIEINMESRVDLLHLRLIVFSKQLAKQGVGDIIEGFIRMREISPKAFVAVSHNNSLEELFTGINEKLRTSNVSLFDFFDKSSGWTPQIATARVWEVYRGIHSPTQDVTLPIIDRGEDTTIKYMGSAILNKGKMKRSISTDETLLINVFNGNSVYGKIEVLDTASVMIVSNKINNQARIVKDKPYLNSKLKLNIVVLETKGKATETEIKRQLNVLLTNRFKKLLEKTQRERTDVLGVGQHFRSVIPFSNLKNWKNSYYPSLNVSFDVTVGIRNKGNLKTLSGE